MPALTAAPTTRLVPNTTYQVADPTKRHLDSGASVVVEVDPNGSGYVVANPASYSVGYLYGAITFAADQGADALVRVTATYLPTSSILAASSLTTLDAVKADLAIGTLDTSNDAVLERIINAASEAAAKYCGRKLHYEAVTSERVKGFATTRLMLRRTPVAAVTSIVIDGETVDATTYYVEDADVGFVYRASGWDWTAPYRSGLAAPDKSAGDEEGLFLVTYTGGWVTPVQNGTGSPALVRSLPYDIEEAIIMAVAAEWRRRGKRQGLDTETEDQAQAVWGGNLLPSASIAVLKRYRRSGG